MDNIKYVCGRCGEIVVCISTTENEVTTIHVFCSECDKEKLDEGRTTEE